MKILITGAKGQLGRDCSNVLATEHITYPLGSRELDITDMQQVSALLDTIRPDAVINCAAFTGVDACEKDSMRCLRINGEGPGNLAAGCAVIGARLIHISTDYVFDGTKPVPEPYREADPVGPVSVYGSSKLTGEENVRKNATDYLILRTAWLYGIGGTNFLKTMLKLARSKPRQKIRVVNDQFGSLTWTYSLALQIKLILETNLRGIVHATAEGYCSWYEGAKYFLERMNIPHELTPCSTREYPTPARRPANSILANEMLHQNDLNRMNDWKQDIDSFVDRYRPDLMAEAEGGK